ncbi:MAG: glycosyltransferase family 4 protein [Deltaproteobacteria bacterium]|nr:glycosyltransferase family 4 protein [Deltaproteobacteria bacterium]
MTHVLFDLRVVGPRWHGISRHAAQLFAALQRRSFNVRFTAIARPSCPRALLPPGDYEVLPAEIRPYGLGEQTLLPAMLGRANADLYYSPTYVVPFACPIPFVFTVHDLIDVQAPNAKLKHRLYFRRILPSLVDRARAVVTVSEFSRRTLLDFGLPARKVVVVPNGHALNPFPNAVRLPRLLHMTNGRPHKNTSLVFRLAHRLLPRFPELRLLCVGLSALPPEGRGLGDRVDLRPVVDPGELARVYSESVATLVPSYAEGFGLPALESMACGTPVVVSNRASLPEVVGDAAPALDPDDLDAWERTVSRILTDNAFAADLASRGLARAQTMTWDRSAAIWADVVTRICGR